MENRKKLLFANKQKFTNEMFDQLSEIVDVMFLDGPETDNYDSVDFSDIDGVVCFNFFKNNDINRFPKLNYIHTTSTGYDQFDLKDLKDRGVTLKNCPGVHSIPISEFVIGSILQIYKKFDKLKSQQRAHYWHCDWELEEIYGKRVLITGTGSIGQHVAERIKAFSPTVIGLDAFPDNSNGYFDEVMTMDHMDEELPKADIIINCIPLFDNTYHLFDKKSFELMKDDAVFINITRGPVVDNQALLDTLKSGKLKGAAVDVWENEPLDHDSEFWDIDRLIVSAHNCFAGNGNNDRLFKCIYNDTKDWAEGKLVANLQKNL